jgi:hypothetical protein
MMNINGKAVMIDINGIEMAPGDTAAIIRHDGSLGLSDVSNFRKEGAAARAGLESLDECGVEFAQCTILGRVVASATA